MRVLALDISTKTGWALLEGPAVPASQESIKVLETGRITLPGDQKVRGFAAGKYPWDYLQASKCIADQVQVTYSRTAPDLVVIEETNGSKSRYTQKQLEWLHYSVLEKLHGVQVVYVNTGDWRRIVGAQLTKEDKRLNAKVRKLKAVGDKQGLKALGARGKIGKKHVAIRFVNTTYGMDLKMKDNDVADAICQGTAYFLGVRHCDGN